MDPAPAKFPMRRRRRLAPYYPLLAVAVEIAWLGVLFLGFIFMVGDEPPTTTPAQEQLFDLIAALPALAGLLLGVAAIARGWATSPREWICVFLGLLGCALFVAGFGWGFFH